MSHVDLKKRQYHMSLSLISIHATCQKYDLGLACHMSLSILLPCHMSLSLMLLGPQFSERVVSDLLVEYCRWEKKILAQNGDNSYLTYIKK